MFFMLESVWMDDLGALVIFFQSGCGPFFSFLSFFPASALHATLTWTELDSEFLNVSVSASVPRCLVSSKGIKAALCCWLWLSVCSDHRLQGLSADGALDMGHKTDQNVTSSSQRADSLDRVSESTCVYLLQNLVFISARGWLGCCRAISGFVMCVWVM